MEKISDERLKKGIAYNNIKNMVAKNEVAELRQTIADQSRMIERLVENSKALAGNTQSLMNNLPDSELDIAREVWGNTNVSVVWHWKEECRKSIEEHTALLAELEGKGFEATMKRVVDENIGAWKALGEEGKG